MNTHESTALAISPNAFDLQTCHALAAAIRGASGGNALSGAFQGTYGFQRVFRRDGLELLLSEHGFLEEFLAEAMVHASCNAFYFNALIIGDEREVARHQDCSLDGWLGWHCPPLEVTVLYAQVPDVLSGGQLELFEGTRHVATCSPRLGAVVRFAGHLIHRVTPVQSPEPRVSLVLEQYPVATSALAQIPRYSATPDGFITRRSVAEKLRTFLSTLPESERGGLSVIRTSDPE